MEAYCLKIICKDIKKEGMSRIYPSMMHISLIYYMNCPKKWIYMPSRISGHGLRLIIAMFLSVDVFLLNAKVEEG